MTVMSIDETRALKREPGGGYFRLREKKCLRLCLGLCAAPLILSFGCHSYDVTRVSNAERTATVWQDGAPRMCVEYSTAAEVLDSTKSNLSLPFKVGKVELSVETAQSFAQIYTVGDIMQFGHATLYRLCEAYSNGAIDKEKFAELFGRTIDQMGNLLDQESALRTKSLGVQVDSARQELTNLKDEAARLESVASPTPQDLERKDALPQLIEKTRMRLEVLLKLQNLTLVIPQEADSPVKSEGKQHAVPEERQEYHPTPPSTAPARQKPPAKIKSSPPKT